jgi:tetratricopeptide (TPR) repeat protein
MLLVVTLMVFNFAHSSLESSIDSLKLEIEKTPGDYDLHFNLGMCYYSLQDYDQAFHEFVKVLSLEKDHMPAIRKLAFVYGHLGEYESMLEFCNTSMRKFGEPTYFLSYASGIANALLGKYDAAIECYDDALALSPYPECEYQKEFELAVIHHASGDTIEGNKLLNKSLSGVEGFRRGWDAIYYFWFGRYDEAVRRQNNAMEENVDLYDMYNLGVYQVASGDKSGLVTIESAFGKDTTGLVRAVYDAIIYILSDSLSDAERTLKQKIPHLGASGMANGLLAWTLEKLDRSDEAKKYWFKCYGKLPLAIDIESMRYFIDYFLSVIR